MNQLALLPRKFYVFLRTLTFLKLPNTISAHHSADNVPSLSRPDPLEFRSDLVEDRRERRITKMRQASCQRQSLPRALATRVSTPIFLSPGRFV